MKNFRVIRSNGRGAPYALIYRAESARRAAEMDSETVRRATGITDGPIPQIVDIYELVLVPREEWQ